MKVYKAELDDGLSSQISASAKITLACSLKNNRLPLDQAVAQKILDSCAEELKQDDLYYLNAVLVSTGWNGNDDVFLPDHLWAARNTPSNKKFNFMHNENDIIGHMTNSVVVDEDGNDISNLENPPTAFDIIVSAVIYDSWRDPEQRDRIKTLITEIENGDWSVSMECMFSDFDYAVFGADGNHKVISRNESSAFLTKHLRIYGGTGKYEDFTIGRILKNITFSGNGIVDIPANTRSIILSKDTNPFESPSLVTVATIKSEINDMTIEQLQAENDKLRAEITSAKDASSAKAVSLAENRVNKLEETVASNDSTIATLTADKDAAVADLKVAKAELETAKSELKTAKDELDVVQAKFNELEADRVNDTRTVSLIEMGLSRDEAIAKVEKFSKVDDEAFATILDMVKEQVETAKAKEDEAEAKKDGKDKKNPFAKDKDKDKKDDEGKDDAKASDDTDVADDVDDVETEDSSASLNGPDDTKDETATAAFNAVAGWFRNGVLSTTKQAN